MPATEARDIVDEVGRLLKEARSRSGLSLEAAAARTNLSAEHLQEVENGYREPPRANRHGPTLLKLERIANIYRLHVELVR